MVTIEQLKTIGKVLREADKIEQYQQILDVQQQLLDLQDENIRLKENNRSLTEKLLNKESLKFEKHSYWKQVGDNNDGPFCSRCWDKDGLLIRLHEGGEGCFFCPDCQNGGYY